MRYPDHYQYDFNLAAITEVWRRGSVIASWLLDLTAASLVKDPDLSQFSGRVSDSGEGRWTVKAAIDTALFSADAAKQMKLVDEVVAWEAFRDALKAP